MLIPEPSFQNVIVGLTRNGLADR